MAALPDYAVDLADELNIVTIDELSNEERSDNISEESLSPSAILCRGRSGSLIVLRDKVVAGIYVSLACRVELPDQLRALVAEFTDVQLQFEPQENAEHIEISEMMRTVTNTAGAEDGEQQQNGNGPRCYHTIATNKWMEYGSHQMKLRLETLSTPSGVEIGVIGRDFNNWTGYIGFNYDGHGWVWLQPPGIPLGPSHKGAVWKLCGGHCFMTGKGLEEGDVITVTLDADAGRVTYKINDDDEFVGFENVDQLPLKFAVSVWSGSKLSIID